MTAPRRYFYLPLIVRYPGALTKLFASFLTFCFVYIWHGQQKTILIWSILNFLGVTLEAVGKGICEVPAYKRIEVSRRYFVWGFQLELGNDFGFFGEILLHPEIVKLENTCFLYEHDCHI